MDEIFDRQQAADYLKIKVNTLDVWRNKGIHKIKYMKIGHNVRYRKSDLDEFLDDHVVGNEDTIDVSDLF